MKILIFSSDSNLFNNVRYFYHVYTLIHPTAERNTFLSMLGSCNYDLLIVDELFDSQLSMITTLSDLGFGFKTVFMIDKPNDLVFARIQSLSIAGIVNRKEPLHIFKTALDTVVSKGSFVSNFENAPPDSRDKLHHHSMVSPLRDFFAYTLQ